MLTHHLQAVSVPCDFHEWKLPFPRMETLVSSKGNGSFLARKRPFPRMETKRGADCKDRRKEKFTEKAAIILLNSQIQLSLRHLIIEINQEKNSIKWEKKKLF